MIQHLSGAQLAQADPVLLGQEGVGPLSLSSAQEDSDGDVSLLHSLGGLGLDESLKGSSDALL